MSYILDALKRADAERERGQMPGLHTRTTIELDTPLPKARGITTSRWLIALSAMLGLSALLWWWVQAMPPDASSVSATAPVGPTPMATASPAPPSAPATPAAPIRSPEPAVSRRSVVSETSMPVLPILSPAPPAPPPPAPLAKASAAPPPAIPAADAQRAPNESVTAAAKQQNTGAPAPSGATAPTTAAAVQSFAELSPQDRARLPAVSVNGSTYSKNPALRMLIVNGKVVQEGGEIAAGLTLETIEPRSAVLNHQGVRYRIGY